MQLYVLVCRGHVHRKGVTGVHNNIIYTTIQFCLLTPHSNHHTVRKTVWYLLSGSMNQRVQSAVKWPATDITALRSSWCTSLKHESTKWHKATVCLFHFNHSVMIILNSKYKLFLHPLIFCTPIKILKTPVSKNNSHNNTTHQKRTPPHPPKVALFRIKTMLTMGKKLSMLHKLN